MGRAEGSCQVNVHPLSWCDGSGFCMLLDSFSPGLGHPAGITALQCPFDFISKLSHGPFQQGLSYMSKLVMEVIDMHSLMSVSVNMGVIIIFTTPISPKILWCEFHALASDNGDVG